MMKVLIVLAALIIGGLLGAIGLAWQADRPVEALATRWAAPPSSFVELDGMAVHVRDEGPRDDPEPLLLIHGTGSSLHTWDAWVDRLKGSHRIIRFDRPGFGLTGPHPNGDYSLAYHADFTRRLMDGLRVDRAIVVGNSSGGEVAWRLAASHPERVSKLILIAPAGYPRTQPLPLALRIAATPVIGPIAAHLANRSVVAKNVASSFGDPSKVTTDDVDAAYQINLRSGVRSALGSTIRQSQVFDPALIRQVRVPTVIIWGGKDSVIPPADAARFHRDIAGSELVVLPRDGHIAQQEDPDGTIAAAARLMRSSLEWRAKAVIPQRVHERLQ